MFKSILSSFALVALLSLSACSKKKVGEESLTSSTMGADENALGDSDSGKAHGLQSINFGYDSFTLDAKAKEVLGSNAKLLKDKSNVKIQVEGHCDARGGIQYNLGLGEKRANIVKKYLVSQGVKSDRISTISFGKEKLLDSSDSEEAHAKNRRANFVVTSK